MLLTGLTNLDLTAHFLAQSPYDIIYAFYLYEKKHIKEIKMEKKSISFSVGNPHLIDMKPGQEYEITVNSNILLFIGNSYMDFDWRAPAELLEKYEIEVNSSESEEEPAPEQELYTVTPSWHESPEPSIVISDDSEEESEEEESQDFYYKRYMYT